MKKYIIILFSMLLLIGGLTNAQTIKRSKQKTEQTQKSNTTKNNKKTSKSTKVDKQKSNSSTSAKGKATQKREKPSDDMSTYSSRSNSSSISSQSTESTTRPTAPTTYPITITCNVNNASLFVDGKLVGSANGSYNLTPGMHSVAIKCSGYNDRSAIINVTSSTAYHYDLVQAIDIRRIRDNMVLIHGGSFKMGATREQGGGTGKNEKPTHKVTLSDYYICKYEVTQELWQAVMGTNPSYFTGSSRLPVECVSWEDCQEFLRKFNALTGMHYRLPTEAEWEYAARGGNRSSGYKYAGAKDLASVAWYDRNSGSMTHSVGTKSPNELGLYDMSGNVAEWCQDWYGGYTNNSLTNPTGPFSGTTRVFRGGSWNDAATYCRIANRLDNDPSYSYFGIGLRLAADSL